MQRGTVCSIPRAVVTVVECVHVLWAQSLPASHQGLLSGGFDATEGSTLFNDSSNFGEGNFLKKKINVIFLITVLKLTDKISVLLNKDTPLLVILMAIVYYRFIFVPSPW